MVSMVTLHYEIDNTLDEVIAKLEIATSGIAIGGVLQAVLLPYLQQRAASRFSSEGDDVTGPWEPLKPATEQFRDAQGFGRAHPINHRTGELENYIVGTAGAVIPTANSATLTYPGNPPSGRGLKDKVKRAQQGDQRTVARPVLGVNEADLIFAVAALDTMFTQALK